MVTAQGTHDTPSTTYPEFTVLQEGVEVLRINNVRMVIYGRREFQTPAHIYTQLLRLVQDASLTR
jgi:hypothetical protein